MATLILIPDMNFLVRNGIMAGASPWVAAENTLQGQPPSLDQPVLAEGFQGIAGTGRGIAATCRQERGDK